VRKSILVAIWAAVFLSGCDIEQQQTKVANKPSKHIFSEEEYRTTDGGLICIYNGRMSQAAKAYLDDNWLNDIGCIKTKEGLRVVRIKDGYAMSDYEWYIRVFKPDGTGINAYTWRCNLAFSDGVKIDKCFD
jgi:hypothetical protein